MNKHHIPHATRFPNPIAVSRKEMFKHREHAYSPVLHALLYVKCSAFIVPSACSPVI